MPEEFDMTEQIGIWRAAAADGTLTLDEMKKAIQALRTSRAAASTKAKAKGASKKVINSDAMLGELAGL